MNCIVINLSMSENNLFENYIPKCYKVKRILISFNCFFWVYDNVYWLIQNDQWYSRVKRMDQITSIPASEPHNNFCSLSTFTGGFKQSSVVRFELSICKYIVTNFRKNDGSASHTRIYLVACILSTHMDIWHFQYTENSHYQWMESFMIFSFEANGYRSRSTF